MSTSGASRPGVPRAGPFQRVTTGYGAGVDVRLAEKITDFDHQDLLARLSADDSDVVRVLLPFALARIAAEDGMSALEICRAFADGLDPQ